MSEPTVSCLHEGDAVKWNPFNRVVQCHRCGLVFPERTAIFQREATRRILFSDEYRLDIPVTKTRKRSRKRESEARG